jgi:long-chain fatty acid transport protein
MSARRLSRTYVAFALLLLASPFAVAGRAQGGGVANYEVSTPNLGEAYAGHAAVANDASTAFLNAAGMTRLDGTHALLGGEMARLSSGFVPDARNTISGGGGDRVGTTLFIPGSYVVGRLNDRLRAGFSFNSPFAIKVDYDPTWAGRYLTSYISFVTLEARPSLAYRLSDRLSVGGGLSVQRVSFQHRNAVVNVLDPGRADGSVEVDFHDWGFGVNGSALLEANERTRLGLTYRSKVTFSLSGEVQTHDLGPNLAALLPSGPSSGNVFSLPQGLNLSVHHEASDALALLADVGWSDWSVFGRPPSWTEVTGSASPEEHLWRDTWRLGLGLRYRLSDRARLQAGASYDSSPVEYTDRGPDAPIDRELRYATGLQYAWKPGVTLGLSLLYKDLGPARIESPDFAGVGRLSGTHEASRMMFAAFTLRLEPRRARP